MRMLGLSVVLFALNASPARASILATPAQMCEMRVMLGYSQEVQPSAVDTLNKLLARIGARLQQFKNRSDAFDSKILDFVSDPTLPLTDETFNLPNLESAALGLMGRVGKDNALESVSLGLENDHKLARWGSTRRLKSIAEAVEDHKFSVPSTLYSPHTLRSLRQIRGAQGVNRYLRDVRTAVEEITDSPAPDLLASVDGSTPLNDKAKAALPARSRIDLGRVLMYSSAFMFPIDSQMALNFLTASGAYTMGKIILNIVLPPARRDSPRVVEATPTPSIQPESKSPSPAQAASQFYPHIDEIQRIMRNPAELPDGAYLHYGISSEEQSLDMVFFYEDDEPVLLFISRTDERMSPGPLL